MIGGHPVLSAFLPADPAPGAAGPAPGRREVWQSGPYGPDIEIVADSGTGFAFPSRTLCMAKDQGVGMPEVSAPRRA